MKVVCVNNNKVESMITIGKVYDVIVSNYDSDNGIHHIIGDNGFKHVFLKYRFISLKKYRTERLKEILEN